MCSLRAVSGDDLPVVYGFRGEELGNFTINEQTGDIYTTRAFDYDSTDRQFDVSCHSYLSASMTKKLVTSGLNFPSLTIYLLTTIYFPTFPETHSKLF